MSCKFLGKKFQEEWHLSWILERWLGVNRLSLV